MDQSELDLLRATARESFAHGAHLADLGELGLLGLLTPESHGGSGWQLLAATTVAAEAGRALSPVPWAGTLLAAAAMAQGHSDPVRVAALLGGSSSGAFVERAAAESDLIDPPLAAAYLVPGGRALDVLILARPGGPLIAISVDAPGVCATDQDDDPIDSSRPTVLVTLEDAHGQTLPCLAPDALADAAVLLACADTLGTLAATSELVARYLSERDAFGQPLASFQGLQHRLADLEILVAAADALVWAAAAALADHDPQAHHLVNATHTYLAQRATAALDDCVQLSGGMGVTWEWPVHHAMRRALINAAVRVPTIPSPQGLRESLDTERPVPASDFRAHVRAVIAEHQPPPAREGHRAPTSPAEESALRGWYRTMFDTGLLGASWPQEWGGNPHHDPVHQLVLTEELIRARVPRPIDQVMLASHLLLHVGTVGQKQHYLPRIRSAQDVWCQLFSEPGAGSDLAGVTTRATAQPDGTWMLSGQKTWTTDGHWAQYGLALVRTSEEAKRHAGLTVFIVAMDSPGVTVTPIRLMSGAHDVNTVFLDDVVVTADAVLGEIGQGWAVCMAGLEGERFGVSGNVVLLEYLVRDVAEVAESLTSAGIPVMDDPGVRLMLRDLLAEVEAARTFVTGQVTRMEGGREGVADASIAKILYTESYNRIARRGMELVTTYGPVPSAGAAAAGRLRDAWFWSRVLTISGGSSEVMRNIIAKRRLRLPSAP